MEAKDDMTRTGHRLDFIARLRLCLLPQHDTTANMQLQRILQTLLLSLTPIAQAAELTINLGSSSLLPNPSTLPASTHATLLSPDGQLYNARLTRTNSLIFKNLSLGSHLLTIYSPAIVYPPFRVDVDNKSEEPSTTQTDPLAPTSSASAADTTGSSLQTIQVYQTFRANEWSNKGPRLGVSNTGQLILTILPSARKEFYQKRGGFNILSFFMSPMILMAVVGLGMVFGMPYLLENSKSSDICFFVLAANMDCYSGSRNEGGIRRDP